MPFLNLPDRLHARAASFSSAIEVLQMWTRRYNDYEAFAECAELFCLLLACNLFVEYVEVLLQFCCLIDHFSVLYYL